MTFFLLKNASSDLLIFKIWKLGMQICSYKDCGGFMFKKNAVRSSVLTRHISHTILFLQLPYYF